MVYYETDSNFLRNSGSIFSMLILILLLKGLFFVFGLAKVLFINNFKKIYFSLIK